MSEYSNLRKYVKTFNFSIYNSETETGYWKSTIIDGIDVWYIEVPILEHTIVEPSIKTFKLNIDSTYEEFEPYKIIIDPAYNIFMYVRFLGDISNFGRFDGKMVIF